MAQAGDRQKWMDLDTGVSEMCTNPLFLPKTSAGSLKEIKHIIRYFDHAPEDEKMAIATVVRVEGSSYRRMGARMLVSENGTWVGGISGGCLEGDALKRARMAILKGKASIMTYDTSMDDDHQIGVGLGCNGIIDVLISPVEKGDPENQIELLRRIIYGRRVTNILVKITRTPDDTLLGKLVHFTDSSSLQILSQFCDTEALTEVISGLNKSKNIVVNDELTLFAEVIPPPFHLILLGHQYDLYPLIRQTLELGWEITVVAPENKVSPIEGVTILKKEDFDHLTFDEYTAVILMSHSLQTDKENLRKLLKKEARYIGMLGPRVRSERIWQELADESEIISDAVMANIYAPVGLDMGATTPDEIALSMLAEIKGVFSKKTPAHLRDKKQPIHERDQPMTFT